MTIRTDDEWAEEYTRRFCGREGFYGTWEGGSRATEASIPELCYRHVTDQERIGIYPMVPIDGDWYCRWGCVDFDIKSERHKTYDYETPEEAQAAAEELVAVLDYFHIPAWIEQTRSNGRHVWVHTITAVTCKTMREALLVASAIAQTPTREVNPKAIGYDDPVTLGNYVRLPSTPAARKGGMWDCGYAGIGAIQALAQRYVPPPAPPRFDGPVRRIQGRDGAYFSAIIAKGPAEGQDRSSWLWSIARLCAERDIEYGAAIGIVSNADERCGKFVNRRNRNEVINEMVRKAYV